MSRSLRPTLIPAASLILALALCPAAVRAATPPATIQQRLDALLKHRLRPEPLPVDLPNPFLLFNGGIRDSATEEADSKSGVREAPEVSAGAAAALPPPTSAEMLSDCAARLKIGGIIIINGQTQISINGVLRKEGDTLTTDWNNTIVNLRIVRFLSGQVVLRFREAETTLKF